MFGVLLAILEKARPQVEGWEEKYAPIYRRSYWDKQWLAVASILLSTMFIASIAGLFINSRRLKRKTDNVRFTLVVTLILSIVGMVVAFLRF